MQNVIRQWGNGLGLRIPAAIAAEMRLKHGTPVTLRLVDGALTVRVAQGPRRRKRFNLGELLARVTPENMQPTYEWDPPPKPAPNRHQS